MNRISAVLIVLLIASISFGFVSVPPATAGKSLEFRYVQLAKVDVNGDAAIDSNLAWHDIGNSASSTTTAGPNNVRWLAKSDEWSWLQFQFYFHGKDGNDANVGQADVNIFGANTFGGGKPLFHSTIHAGNEAMSHDPNLGTPYRTNLQPDPNYKWANADGNFVDTSDLGVFRSGTSGTTSTYGITRYTILTVDKFYRVQINNITPTAKIDYVYCIVTGGK